MAFLRSVEAADIDDSFNPNKLKDKWIKFFRGNMTRPQVDADTALKADANDNLANWLKVELQNLDSYQLVRALLISGTSSRTVNQNNRNKALQLTLFQILRYSFPIKHSAYIPLFAQAVNVSQQSLFYNSDNILLDCFANNNFTAGWQDKPTTELLPTWTYPAMVRACTIFKPILLEFFADYTPAQ